MAITILTGAGASKPLGYPMTKEFFPSARYLDSGNQEVLKHLVAHLGVENLDVEDVLSLIEPVESFLDQEAGKFFTKNVSGPWPQLVKTFARYTREQCFNHYGRLPDTEAVKKLYEPLFRACGWKNRGLSLFTTNYDPVTDTLLELAESKGINVCDGFKPRGAWQPSLYRENRSGLNVYRLHGSMSWIRQNGTIVNTRDYLRRYGNAEHLIIYPGYKGNPEDGGEEAFAFPHTALRSNLEKATHFIVIGFSFRDKHINGVISKAMSLNSKLCLIVVNPEWPKEADSWERVVHVDSKFGGRETINRLCKELGEP